MHLPVIIGALLALLVSGNAVALHVGQLETRSRLGEPLRAEVALYGVAATRAATLDVEVKPELTVPRGAPERRAAESLSAVLATRADGSPIVRLESSAPIAEPVVRFRLRLGDAAGAAIGHFTLALDPPAAPRARSVPPLTGDVRAGDYGPVRPGQTLWRILNERGLTGGDSTQTIARVVAMNPHAFVGGDANRLRVGVTLTLPAAGTTLAARPQPAATTPRSAAPAATTAPVAPAAQVTPVAPTAPAAAVNATPVSAPRTAVTPAELPDDITSTAARLQAVSEKFAAIRARYERQRAAAVPAAAPPDAAADTVTQAPAMASSGVAAASAPAVTSPDTDAAPADNATPVAAPPVVVRPAVERAALAPAGDGGPSLARLIMLGAAAVISAMALIGGGLFAYRTWRRNREHGHAAAADRNLVEEVARKAEQRLRLEGELRQRLAEKREARDAAPSARPAAQGTIERSIEQGDALASLDEIENRIAHGQYAEAEAMLNDVIERTPANHRAKLRLAEIYYLNERTDEFVALARELHDQHRADIGDEGWQRVMRMGKVMAPDRPPFSGPVAVERPA